DLLSFARIDAGHESVNLEPVLLSEVVDQSLMFIRPLAEAKGLKVRVGLPAEPVMLNTDRRKLRQILINVLANAVKYSAVGEISIVVRVGNSDALMHFQFEITDQGVGMTVAEQEHAFDAFWQANTAKA